MKVKLGTKAFIVYLIAQVVIHFSFMLSPKIPYPISHKLKLLFSGINILFYLIYAVTIVLLLKRIKWGWITATILPIWVLINPNVNPYSQIPIGKLPAIYYSLMLGNVSSLILHMIESVVPIIVILFALLHFFSKKLIANRLVWTFMIFAVLQLSEIWRPIVTESINATQLIQSILIIAIYIAAVLSWERYYPNKKTTRH